MLSRLLLKPLDRAGRAWLWVVGCSLVTALTLTGCDNPACVFGGDCTGSTGGATGGGLGASAAELPTEGAWVDSVAPSVTGVFPSGASADPETPIVLVFSESMQAGATQAGFDLFLIDASAGTGIPTPVTLGPGVLLAGGRVLVLRPAAALERGETYEVRHRMGIDPSDLNGQALVRPDDDVAGSFTVANTGPTSPLVLTTFPPNGATFQSDTPELVVVFSRAVDELTVDDDSFAVTVDGADPTFDAVPTPIVIQDLFPITDTRIYTWQSLDNASQPASLGRGGSVELLLSPDPPANGNKITDLDGNALLEATIAFDIAPFEITGAQIQSMPSDAINIDNLIGAGALNIVVTVEDVEATDDLDVFLFGFQAGAEPMDPPQLTSLFRSVPIGVTSMPMVPVDVSLSATALDLVASNSPLIARFLDGPVGFAFRVRRGTTFGPVTLLDVDPLMADVQSPVIDTIPPVLLGLGGSGMNLASLSSDLQDLVVTGRATESIRAAFVTAVGLGDNGPDPMNPPVVAGSDPFGLFVARPVTVADGIIPPASLPVSFTLTIYDQALNPALVPTVATYTQLGVSGPDALGPSQVTVVTFDASTQALVAGARVFTHGDDGTTTRLIDEQLTAGDGSVTLDASLLGGEELIVTVDGAGYDLFTFHGVVVDRLGVPLEPTTLTDGRARGTVSSPTSLSATTRSASDSRFLPSNPRLAPVSGCSLSSATNRFNCPWGPEFVTPRRIGSQSALVTTTPATEAQYSAFTFLVGFELGLPAAPPDPGATESTTIDLPFLLNEVGLDFEETAIDVAVHTLDTSNQPGGASAPEVTLEAISPGVVGSVVVGAGIAFPEVAAEQWRVRSAYPGAVDPFLGGGGDLLGRYVDSGSIEADLFLRVSQTDGLGNRGVARPRLSVTTNSLTPPASSVLTTPAPGGNSGGASYDLIFTDVLADGAGGAEGIYRAHLTGSGGRGWTLYRADPAGLGATDVRIRVPDLTPMGNALPDGTIRCSLSAFAWPGLDLTRFLWTDLAREPAQMSDSIEFTYTQP